MMRGGSIVTTLIFSVIFLKSKVMKNQLAGAGLVLIGVMVVGLSNMVFKDQSGDGASAVILILCSGFANRRLFAHHSLSFHQRIPVCVWAKTFVKVSPRATPSCRIWRNVWLGHWNRLAAHPYFRSLWIRCWGLCFQLQRNAFPWETWKILCWNWSKWSFVILCHLGYLFNCNFQHLWCYRHQVY